MRADMPSVKETYQMKLQVKKVVIAKAGTPSKIFPTLTLPPMCR